MGRIQDACEQVLQDEGWDYEVALQGGRETIVFGFTGAVAHFGCRFDVYEDTERLCFLAYYQPLVPEELRVAVAEYLTRANFTVLIGNFELDFETGDVRFRASADVESLELTPVFVKNLALASLITAEKYYPGLVKVLENGLSPADAFAIVRGAH